MEKNKIQLRGAGFFCSLEVENLRGGEESSKSSWSSGQVRDSRSRQRENPGLLPPPPAPPARPAHASRPLRPNTASGGLALTQRRRSLLSAGLCAVPAGLPGRTPAPFPHAAGAELRTEQPLVVTSCTRPVLHSSTSTTTSLPPERYAPLQLAAPSEREEIPPSLSPSSAGIRSSRREGEATPRVAVLKLSQGKIALPRLRMAPPSNCKQAEAGTSAARAHQTRAG